jgi:alpha-glucosidase
MSQPGGWKRICIDLETLMNLRWWQKAVFYQIYPRSFADGNGDGIGDFSGMISKLDYLHELGVDAIWISPHYPSPNVDCGYDIADYTGVAPEYGTLEEFQQFLEGAHQRGMRVILDLVLNHTSDQHAWFQESRSCRHNPKRDWYIWSDGRNGGPPNNWNSPFGGSAWEWDETTGQYYYHFFFKEQPDLNWRNPLVKEAMFAAVRFWLDRGVDGFRLDAIGTIFEHPDMPDHPVRMSGAELRREFDRAETNERRVELMQLWIAMEKYQIEQPGMHELMQELRAVIDEYDDRMLIGETEDLAYHGNGTNELHLVFNFPLMKTDRLTASWVRRNQNQRLRELNKISPDAWACNTLGNHDSPRVWSRFGHGTHDAEVARLSLALMLTLRGTPFLYNGEEIGMTDLLLNDLGQFRDLLGIWYYQAQVEQLGMKPDEALQRAACLTRDKNRTPMQWANDDNAGFCPAATASWLPVNPNFSRGINVQDQEGDPDSLLNFYRRMLRLRKENPALIGGSYQAYHPRNPRNLAFLRQIPEQTCLVVLNFSDQEAGLVLPDTFDKITSIFSTNSIKDEVRPGRRIHIEPFRLAIFELI